MLKLMTITVIRIHLFWIAIADWLFSRKTSQRSSQNKFFSTIIPNLETRTFPKLKRPETGRASPWALFRCVTLGVKWGYYSIEGLRLRILFAQTVTDPNTPEICEWKSNVKIWMTAQCQVFLRGKIHLNIYHTKIRKYSYFIEFFNFSLMQLKLQF